MSAEFRRAAPEPDRRTDRGWTAKRGKTQIRNALSADPPDVVNWYAANRMGPYVNAGLFMDITEWWDAGDFEGLESVRGALTQDGRVWGVPYTYYQWGMYYRRGHLCRAWPVRARDLGTGSCQLPGHRRLGPALLCHRQPVPVACGAAGSTTSTCGPTGSISTWNLPVARSPGPMTACGRPSQNWRTLIDMGGFIPRTTRPTTGRRLLPLMINGEATGYLMGNFAVDLMRSGGLSDDQLDFYQFPIITPRPAAGRGRTDRHVPRRRRCAERRGGPRLPAICRLGRGPDPDQRARWPWPAAGERQRKRCG